MSDKLKTEWKDSLDNLESYISDLESECEELTLKISNLKNEIGKTLWVYHKILKSKSSDICLEPVQKKRKQVRYSDEEKDLMVELFRKYNKNRKRTIDELHTRGINISYRHLGTVLQQRRVRLH